MAIKFLADTNIILEILLAQNKSEVCKDFLQKNLDTIAITDFTLHSIGVILLRNKQGKAFSSFCSDVLKNFVIYTLESSEYTKIDPISLKYNLDFDDTYQFLIAKNNSLTVVTMDNDFRRVTA